MSLQNRINWRRWIIGSSLLICIMILLVSCGKSEMEQIEEQLKLGQKYLEEQNYEEAVVAFQKVIELDDKEISAYSGLIQAYDGLKDRSQTKNLIEKGFEILTNIEASDKKDEFITMSIDTLMKYQGDSEYMDYLENLMDQYPEIFEDEVLRQHMAEQAGILVMKELPNELKEYQSLYQSGRLEELVQNIRNNEIVTCFVEDQLSILFEYPLLNQVMGIVKEEEAAVVSQRFGMDWEITLQIRRSLMERLKDRLSKLYSLRFVEG